MTRVRLNPKNIKMRDKKCKVGVAADFLLVEESSPQHFFV